MLTSRVDDLSANIKIVKQYITNNIDPKPKIVKEYQIKIVSIYFF